MKPDAETKALRIDQVRLIVKSSDNMETAVNLLIENDLCVSKAQAKRTWYQLRKYYE
jgi:hypothetical protein